MSEPPRGSSESSLREWCLNDVSTVRRGKFEPRKLDFLIAAPGAAAMNQLSLEQADDGRLRLSWAGDGRKPTDQRRAFATVASPLAAIEYSPFHSAGEEFQCADNRDR